MPMKGRFPIRRTLEYLQKGEVVFKKSVKIMTVNYNTHGDLSEGARKFVFFNIPQIQYKNPWVQIMMFKNMTPSPFLRFYLGKSFVSLFCIYFQYCFPSLWYLLILMLCLDEGEQVLVDVEGKDHKEITNHVKMILGKSDKVLEAEALAKMELSNPANFGPKKYFLRECISEVEGQVPHPGFVPLPKEMTGKYRAKLAAASDE
uniref:Small ribosomal subunit protein mS25 n=1 Tax=Sinocyclocheilus rhinocerous TaxID=307959 RepID=A0A673FMG0_9TELE